MMNTAQPESITSSAITLLGREGAKLAHDLIASLDGPAAISVELIVMALPDLLTDLIFGLIFLCPRYFYDTSNPH
jgi:hypothetical protein